VGKTYLGGKCRAGLLGKDKNRGEGKGHRKKTKGFSVTFGKKTFQEKKGGEKVWKNGTKAWVKRNEKRKKEPFSKKIRGEGRKNKTN